MKQLLVIAVALASVNAFATRARVTALANSPHLVDVQSVHANPAYVHQLGDYVTLESGTTAGTGTNTQNATAEGAIVRSMGDAKMGLSLGHQDYNASSWGLRSKASTAALQTNQQNPVGFTYAAKAGDLEWGATLVYSNYKDDSAAAAALAKESSVSLNLGAVQGMMDYNLNLGLTNTAELTNATKFTGTPAIGAHFGYTMDTLYYSVDVASLGYKEETTAAELEKYTETSIMLSVTNSVKKDGSEVFYGAGLNSTSNNETVADTKNTTLKLPLWIGLEVDAASWLVLRGSVTQTLQFVNTTTANGTTTTSPGANDTTVAAGAGLKFNKITVDGTILSGATQTINGTNLLAQVGMTYNF